jgi:hypothetical protein
MMISQVSTQNATFINVLYGISALVTKIQKGYAVTLIDTDAEQIVATKIYPPAMYDQAVAYAKKLANV